MGLEPLIYGQILAYELFIPRDSHKKKFVRNTKFFNQTKIN